MKYIDYGKFETWTALWILYLKFKLGQKFLKFIHILKIGFFECSQFLPVHERDGDLGFLCITPALLPIH